jgi:hypothetical protein
VKAIRSFFYKFEFVIYAFDFAGMNGIYAVVDNSIGIFFSLCGSLRLLCSCPPSFGRVFAVNSLF